MRRLVLVACIAGLLWPAHAEAGWKMDRSLEVANRVWHAPCGGQATISLRTFDVGDTGDAGLAVDPFGPPVPGLAQCVIYLNAQPPEGNVWAFAPMCSVALHEMGHLAGYRDPLNPLDPYHSHNPASVMYASGAGIDPRCRERGRAYLARFDV